MPNGDQRSEGRSNVFLTASLDTGAAQVAVRIRNIASRGMLIEASSLPAVGTRVTLVRGQLSAVGELAWAGSGQGGINLQDSIDVGLWVQRIGHVGQQRVDRVVAAIRSASDIPVEGQAARELASLLEISAALDRLCESLSATPNMSIELGEGLVKLDAIAQALRRLATGKDF